jgi:hypothetical protein
VIGSRDELRVTRAELSGLQLEGAPGLTAEPDPAPGPDESRIGHPGGDPVASSAFSHRFLALT